MTGSQAPTLDERARARGSHERLDDAQRARLPNLIVIGAAKSGTTSLHHYLDEHPEVAMTDAQRPDPFDGLTGVKEPHFFSSPRRFVQLDRYLDLFDPKAKVRGESSTSYTVHPHRTGVAARMHSLIPNARLVYLVRDPVDRAIAHWAELVMLGLQSPSLHETLTDDAPHVYASRYATQLEQYLEHYPREQILVLDQRDLKHSRRETLTELFGFVGVDSSFWTDRFEQLHRPRELPRITPFGRRIRTSAAGRVLGRMPRSLRGPLLAPVRRLFSAAAPAPEPDPVVRERIAELLGDEPDRFRELTGKAFDHWSV